MQSKVHSSPIVAVAASICAAAFSPSFAANPDCPNLEEIIIAAKNHLDIGYTATVPELMRKYRTTDLTKTFELLDADRDKPEYQRARWTLPAWSMDIVLNGSYSRERRVKVDDYVRRRRLLWHAMPYTIETEASDPEEIVRMLAYGSNLSRQYGLDLPRYAKQTDVPEQGWAFATVLANAGVKFLHIGVNGGSKPPAELKKLPLLSWWEGPDGSRILLFYAHEYGWFLRARSTPPKGWRYKSWLVYHMRGDNLGPMTPADSARILAQVQKENPGVKVRYGDPAEFADAIIAEEKKNPTLPVVRGDMPDTWIHGQMSAPIETACHRRATSELITLGVLDTTLRTLGIHAKPVAKTLANGYKESGLYSEHTWGFACIQSRKRFHDPDWRERYEKGEFKDIEDSFEYHKNYAREAHRMAKEGIDERMKLLARSVAADGPRVVVFNPLPYERDAEVEVEMPEGFAIPGGARDGGKVRFLAKGLPAGGYKTFAAKRETGVRRNPDAQKPVPPVLSTRHFTVKFDLERGGIASLVEKATGRELVKHGGHVLGQFLHERFSMNEVKRFVFTYNRKHHRRIDSDFGKGGMPGPDKIPYAAMSPKKWTAALARNALGEVVTLTAGDTLGLAKGYELRFSFPDFSPCVDISWNVTDKKPDPTPEGGWLCLPLNVASPSFRVGRIGGTIDPAKDIIFAANRNLMCVDRAITVRAGATGAGVGVASADLPLWSLGKPGLWRYEPDYVPTEPELFANLYNNQWNTNFPFWIPGSWTASLRVYPIAEGADEEQAVFAPAWEIRQPCVAAFAEAADAQKRVPPAAGGVALSRRGVRVTAFCPNPDGRGTVLRVWEQAGNAGEITVTLPKGMKTDKVQPVNLRGEVAGEPIAVKDGRFSFDLGAWAPKSFILHDGDEQSTAAYRFYRFSVDLTAGDAMQISELKLFDATNDVTRTCAAVRYEESTFNPQFKGYSPLKAVDGDLATKWYDDRAAADKRSAFGKDVWMILEYAKPVAVTRYEWHTADDTSYYTGRNPLAWCLQGSNDGKNWIDLDVVGCANPHTFDKTLAYSRRLDVPREPPDNAIIYPVRTSNGRRLVSYDVNGTTIHELAP